MTKSTTNLSATIDAYGELKAMMAELELKEKALKEALSDLEAGAYEGERYRISISESTRESPDAVLGAQIKEVVEAFRETLSRQYLTAHTKETLVRTHKVTARSGKKVAA